MLNCLLDGKRICSLDVRNEHGVDDSHLKIAWRKAQYDGLLICEDCKNPLDFRCGPVNIPYFAHKPGFKSPDCDYDKIKETEEHLAAKNLLYKYFNARFNNCEVQTNARLSNGRRADILLVPQGADPLAIEFLRSNQKISDWESKHTDYKHLGINDLWFLSNILYTPSSSRLNIFTDFVRLESKTKTLRYLDVQTANVKMVRQIDYKDSQGLIKRNKRFEKDYSLDNITITLSGEIVSDFDHLYEAEKTRFINDCVAEEESRRKEQEELLKRLRKERRPIPPPPRPMQLNAVISSEKTTFGSSVSKSKWNQIVLSGGVEKCIDLLEQCRASKKLPKNGPQRDSELLYIKSCDSIIQKYHSNTHQREDIERLYLRVINLAGRLID